MTDDDDDDDNDDDGDDDDDDDDDHDNDIVMFHTNNFHSPIILTCKILHRC